MKAAIFDIDGTLADATHRLHYVEKKPKRWDLFFEACPQDAPISLIINLMNILKAHKYTILFTSGRSDVVRNETIEWLYQNGAPWIKYCPATLYMRKALDYRPDWLIKREMLVQIRETYPDIRIEYVFDDRDQVVNMWRREGLRCLQVAAGNF